MESCYETKIGSDKKKVAYIESGGTNVYIDVVSVGFYLSAYPHTQMCDAGVNSRAWSIWGNNYVKLGDPINIALYYVYVGKMTTETTN